MPVDAFSSVLPRLFEGWSVRARIGPEDIYIYIKYPRMNTEISATDATTHVGDSMVRGQAVSASYLTHGRCLAVPFPPPPAGELACHQLFKSSPDLN